MSGDYDNGVYKRKEGDLEYQEGDYHLDAMMRAGSINPSMRQVELVCLDF